MTSISIGIDASLLTGRYTGDRTYWRHLVRALTRLRKGHTYILYTPDRLEGFETEGDTAIVRTIPSRNRRWWSLVRLPLAAHKDRVSVVHVQYTISPLLKLPAITTVHDVSFLLGPQWFRPKDRWLLRLTVPASVGRAARVLTVSERSRIDIERLIPSARGKVVVTPLGVPDGFCPAEGANERVERRFGLKQPYVLTVGKIQPRKNIEMLVRAFSAAKQRAALPHCMVLAGQEGWGTRVGGPDVIPLGYVEDEALPDLYRAAEAFLFPSLYEGFGLPVLEAMACACPIVCSDGGALPEVVGDAALVIPAQDESGWVETIIGLLSSPELRNDLARRGLERARMFDWENTAARTASVYEEVFEWSRKSY